jgi:hypothetical protein
MSALLLSAAISVGAAFAKSSQAITGTVTDAMFGAHHMMEGKTPAQCTRECVKEGSDFALASGDKVYILKGDKSKFDKFAGQNVIVKGKVDGKTITVDSIAAGKP